MPKIYADPFKLILRNTHKEDPPPDVTAKVFAALGHLSSTFPAEGDDTTRWADLGEEGWLVCDHLKEVGGSKPRWEGAIMRVRKKDLGHIAGPRGTRPLSEKLSDGEGYSHHVAFLWDIKQEVLWLQRDRFVVGQAAFSDYFRDRLNLSFGMRIILRSDAIERALKIETIKSFDFGFYPHDASDPTGDLARFVQVAQQYGEVRVDVRLSSRRGKSLGGGIKGLVKTIAGAVKRGDNAVTSAKLKGSPEPDEDFATIDLFKDRNELSKDLSDERTRDPQKLIATVRDIWSVHRDTISVEEAR